MRERKEYIPRIIGYFINLESSKKRRKRMEEHLHDMGWQENYERFEAIKGEDDESQIRGLSNGEMGIWKTWIKILEKAKECNPNEYDFLHIIEDDAIMSPKMIDEIKKLNESDNNADIITTDMYVNEEIWRASEQIMGDLKEKDTTTLTTTYTGCLTSSLLRSKSIDKIYRHLTSTYKRKEKLIPLDNTLLRYSNEGKLKILCTIPFLSTIECRHGNGSDIQEFKRYIPAVELTQELNSLLREQMSWLETDETVIDILRTLNKLAETANDTEYIKSLLNTALEYANTRNILKYKHDPRLAGEEKNKQKLFNT